MCVKIYVLRVRVIYMHFMSRYMHMNSTKRLLHTDVFRLADYPDGDDQICPWTIQHRFGPDTRVFNVTLAPLELSA